MILNDVLTKQNVFTKLVLSNGEKELPKELKVKIMRTRMAYNKIKKTFDDDVKEFTELLIPEELKELNSKEARSEEENARMLELTDKVNTEYQEFLIQKGNEEVKDTVNDSFNMDEYSDIIDINSKNDVEINGNTIKAADFLEIVYELFVKED